MLGSSYRTIQQESVFWRRELWERAGGRLDERLTCAADLDLWLRFTRLADFCSVPVVLGGFRRHDDALGEAGDGLYEREASALHTAFVAEYGRRMQLRARAVEAISPGQTGVRRRLAGQARRLAVVPAPERTLRLRSPDVDAGLTCTLRTR